MDTIYLLADRELDKSFGFGTAQIPTIPNWGPSLQETHIAGRIKTKYHHAATIRDIFLVANIPKDQDTDRKGLVGRVDVHRPEPSIGDVLVLRGDVSGARPLYIRLKDNYLQELRKYLFEESASDRIVVAKLDISPAVKRDMERLLIEQYLRTDISPEPTPNNISADNCI